MTAPNGHGGPSPGMPPRLTPRARYDVWEVHGGLQRERARPDPEKYVCLFLTPEAQRFLVWLGAAHFRLEKMRGWRRQRDGRVEHLCALEVASAPDLADERWRYGNL